MLVIVLVDELGFVPIDAFVVVLVQDNLKLSWYSVMSLLKHLFVSLSNNILSIKTSLERNELCEPAESCDIML